MIDDIGHERTTFFSRSAESRSQPPIKSMWSKSNNWDLWLQMRSDTSVHSIWMTSEQNEISFLQIRKQKIKTLLAEGVEERAARPLYFIAHKNIWDDASAGPHCAEPCRGIGRWVLEQLAWERRQKVHMSPHPQCLGAQKTLPGVRPRCRWLPRLVSDPLKRKTEEKSGEIEHFKNQGQKTETLIHWCWITLRRYFTLFYEVLQFLSRRSGRLACWIDFHCRFCMSDMDCL